jgi:HPt (histidine-containing phosphotransfer) domain-containing protein
VLSGNDDPETRTRALAQGASDYLVKLPPKDDLIACIRRHAVANTASRPVALDRAPATLEPGTDETLDRSVLAAFHQADTPGSSDFTRLLIDEFLRDAASQVEVIKDATRRSDGPRLEATAHSLRGSAMTMGARRLGGCAHRWKGMRPTRQVVQPPRSCWRSLIGIHAGFETHWQWNDTVWISGIEL